jgi:predicted dithiol-disulfide oxidoreductase (DUF899 family)
LTALRHLPHGDVTLVVARGSTEEIEQYQKRWLALQWVSSHGSDFNLIIAPFTKEEEEEMRYYNYQAGNS